MKREVAIIGAGTAGLIAAKRLAELGIELRVYDQKRILGYPVRASGILSVKGLGELGVNYSNAVTNTLYGARIHAGGEVMEVVSREKKAHVLDRKRLNELCYDDAAAAGARIVLGERIRGHGLDVLADKGIVVGADGAVSEVAEHFKMGGIKRYCLTYKAEYNISAVDPEIVEVFLDNRITKGLFGWLCANTADILEVGIGIDSKSGNAKKAFDAFVATDEVAGVLDGAKPRAWQASLIPMSLRERIADSKKGVVLVGDAAGQVKPSTGGGIIFGGNAAIMAAEGIRKELEGGGGIKEYERRYTRRYALDTAIHSTINRIYSGLDSRTLGYLIKAFNALRLGSFLGRYGEMDMPSLMLRNFISSARRGGQG